MFKRWKTNLLFPVWVSISLTVYFFSVAQQPNSGLGRLIVDVSTSHNNYTHAVEPCRRDSYQHNTEETQEAVIHALSGIQALDPNNQIAADTKHMPVNYLGNVSTSFYEGQLHASRAEDLRGKTRVTDWCNQSFIFSIPCIFIYLPNKTKKCPIIIYYFNHCTYIFRSIWPSWGCSQNTSVLSCAKSNTYIFTIVWCKNRISCYG